MSRHVVHLLGRLDAGGAEVRLLELLERWDAGDGRHSVVVLSGQAGTLDAAFAALGATVVHRRLDARFPLWFVRYLRAERVTHLHSHVHLMSAYLLALAWVARVPRRIAQVHSSEDGRGSGWPRRAYRAVAKVLLATIATDVIAVSDAVADANFGRHGRLRRRVGSVLGQVDPRRFDPRPRPAGPGARLLVLGYVGGDKNVPRAVAIAAALAERGRLGPVSMRIVGRGPDEGRAAVQEAIDEYGAAAFVELVGERRDVAAELARCDVLLSTSRREGLSGVLLEAAAAGRPVVAASIAPNDEAARYLPAVLTVPLAAEDADWCRVLEDVVTDGSGRFEPAAIRAAFERSPLALDDGLGAYAELWS